MDALLEVVLVTCGFRTEVEGEGQKMMGMESVIGETDLALYDVTN